MDKDEIRWKEYYATVKNRPPRDTLLKALALFEGDNPKLPRYAVDLGAGVGNDTRELIKWGWKVYAYDAQESAIPYIRDGLTESQLSQLSTQVSNFESITLPKEITLINASYSIPFCDRNDFLILWDKINQSLISGGRFSGQIFGNEDEWVGSENMTFFNREELENLFTSFEIEFLEEINEDSKVASGEPKHWHLYHVVAKKT